MNLSYVNTICFGVQKVGGLILTNVSCESRKKGQHYGDRTGLFGMRLQTKISFMGALHRAR